MINGNRIRQARELSGWTQEDLAYKIGIKQPTLAGAESGKEKPSDKVVERVAEYTDFQPSFFEKPDTAEFNFGSMLFRSHSSITSEQRTEAFRHAELLFEIWEELALKVNELPLRLPSFKQEPPALAAQIARSQLGLSPDTPIPYLINLAEKNGVIVLAIPTSLDKRDAFSLWAGSGSRKPIVALSSGAPGDRTAWSVAHELGHLVMHNPIKAFGEGSLEDQANAFAAEFLLPEIAMRREITEPVTLETVAALKTRWKVAMQAIIRRARDLQIINDRQYRYLFEQMIRNGWKINEPCPIPTEKPRALREMAELIYGKPINYVRMSDDTLIGISRLRDIFEAHAARSGEMRQTQHSGNSGRRNNVISLQHRKQSLQQVKWKQ